MSSGNLVDSGALYTCACGRVVCYQCSSSTYDPSRECLLCSIERTTIEVMGRRSRMQITGRPSSFFNLFTGR